MSYWIERTEPSGWKKVSVHTVFDSGDRIRLHLRSSRPGYLYVVNRDSTDKTTVLFPSVQGGDEYIDANQAIVLPASGWIRFDDQPGDETVWVFVSRRPLMEGQKTQALNGPPVSHPVVRTGYNACGDKGMAVESPDALRTSCGGDKGLDVVGGGEAVKISAEAPQPEPVSTASMPLEEMDKGHMLSVKFTLKHR